MAGYSIFSGLYVKKYLVENLDYDEGRPNEFVVCVFGFE